MSTLCLCRSAKVVKPLCKLENSSGVNSPSPGMKGCVPEVNGVDYPCNLSL